MCEIEGSGLSRVHGSNIAVDPESSLQDISIPPGDTESKVTHHTTIRIDLEFNVVDHLRSRDLEKMP